MTPDKASHADPAIQPRLLPCPSCNEVDILEESGRHFAPAPQHEVYCPRCGWRAPFDRWNRRSSAPCPEREARAVPVLTHEQVQAINECITQFTEPHDEDGIIRIRIDADLADFIASELQSLLAARHGSSDGEGAAR